MSWDNRWIDMAFLVASWSKDRSRKVGAVIVDDRQVVVSLGWNGFPRGIHDHIDARHERPAKYLWTEHAERNAFYNAAANGAATQGCILYSVLYPCADCARAIIQGGIKRVVYARQPEEHEPNLGASFDVARKMLAEAGVDTSFYTLSGK